MGGWKGLALQLTFTGGKQLLFVLSELVQEKIVFLVYSNAWF